jgi:hypothetical protein
MSVASLKTTVTWERLKRVSERTWITPAMPRIAFSMGKVTLRSVSSGERPSTAVLICTCTFVTSGKASMGRLWKLFHPTAAKTAQSARTMKRL